MNKLWAAVGIVVLLSACSKTDAKIDEQKLDSPSATAAVAPADKPAATAGESPSASASPGEPAPTASSGNRASSPAVAPSSLAATETRAGDPEQSRTAEWREVTIPAGTILKVNLNTAVGSDTSRVEDSVRGTLRSPVTIKGMQALPAGTALSGYVTDAARSAKVKGRARIAFRFTRVDPPGPDDSMTIRTGTISRLAPGTKKRDATTIGGAVGGAIIGGIIGGGDGAAKGAAIGGAGGTGVVLATRGKEVHVGAGTPLSVRLTQALTVRVPMR